MEVAGLILHRFQYDVVDRSAVNYQNIARGNQILFWVEHAPNVASKPANMSRRSIQVPIT